MKLLSLLVLATAYCANTKVDPSELGLDKTKQTAGYIDVPHGSLFYWLFEARNDPENAPLVIWFNGGPGCSSLSGMLTENGPATIQKDLGLKPNPFSWNVNANVLYLDQPVDVGYSYSTKPITSTVEASEDVTAFVREFYKQYPQYLNNDLHLAGESYAGRYLPVYAEALMTMKDRPKSLKSVLMGDPSVDEYSYYGTNYEYLCQLDGGFPQLVDQETCEAMNASTPHCIAKIAECINSGDAKTCHWAVNSNDCGNVMSGLDSLENSGVNIYNIDQQCEPSRDNSCYTSDNYLEDYFNSAKIKKKLQVHSGVKYQVCNDDVNWRFNRHYDEYHPTQHNVTNILELGVNVLVYNGDRDPLLNWVCARNWTRSLEWSGHQGFAEAIDSPRDFVVNGKKAGEVSHYDKLTFLRVFGSGHMVPMDQPVSAFQMVNSWIKGDYALS